MFAAMPTNSARRLEFFRLALVLIDRGNHDIPPPLSEHFEQVLHQARLLIADPSAISPQVMPQALRLANDLRLTSGLYDALAGVQQLCDVSPEIAHRVLQTLEPSFAPTD